MPIYDLGYRHWTGSWTSHPYRWGVITRQGILLLIRRKVFVALMFLSILPFLVRVVMLYVSTYVAAIPFLKLNEKFFMDFLNQQMIFTFFIAIYAGAGLIANDMRVNALQIYLSKAISRRDYIAGKLGVVAFFLALSTLLPGLLLFLLAALFQSDLAFLRQYYWVAASIVGYSSVIVLSNSAIVLTVSSMSKSSRFAGISFAAVYFFSQILYGVLRGLLRTSKVAWVSLTHNISQVGALLFGAAPPFQSPVWVSMVVLLAIVAVCFWLVSRRVQAVEVVT